MTAPFSDVLNILDMQKNVLVDSILVVVIIIIIRKFPRSFPLVFVSSIILHNPKRSSP